MSKLSVYLEKRIKGKPVGAEYEEAFRQSKMFGITMNKAILGESSKEEIEQSIISMQSSLEIVKACNGSSSDDIIKGVNSLFDITEDTNDNAKVKNTNRSSKPRK